MKLRGPNGPQRRYNQYPTPEQIAAAHAEALAWRERSRTDLSTGKCDEAPVLAPAPPPRSGDGGKQRANFAAQIARAEFGRFYWDARHDGELRRATFRRSATIRPKGKARKA